jgi:hypothetical protein
MGVNGEVERGAAEPLLLRKQVEQGFADADHDA